MRGIVTATWLLLTLSLGGCGYLIPSHHQTTELSALPKGAYRLDPQHATILFKIDHLGFSRLVGRFDRFNATLDFDPERPRAASLTAVIDVASINLNYPSFEQDLRGSGWFDVERFPEARFESRKIEITGEETGIVTGELTLHGVTAPVTLDVTFNGGGDDLLTGAYTLGFAAHGSVLRSTFGLGAYAPAIGDEVLLEIHAEFLRSDSTSPPAPPRAPVAILAQGAVTPVSHQPRQLSKNPS
jgi:polyisoprenoid-binding protein YceI